MSKVVLYHNPRCSQSRNALDIIKEHSKLEDIEIVEYLKEPLSSSQLSELCKTLGIEPKQLVRTKEKILGELGITDLEQKSNSEWLQLMSEHPIIMQRPVVLFEGKGAIGRPEDNVRALFR